MTLSGGVGTATNINFWRVVANLCLAIPGCPSDDQSVAAAGNNAATVVNPTRYTVTAAVTPGAGGSIDLNVAGINSTLTWAGSGTSVWDVITTTPWTGGAAGDNRFYQADRVFFDSRATRSQSASLPR